VAGLLKTSVITNGEKDILRINNQKINWSLKELDRYSSAFAFGLMEAGFARGDSLVLWIDRANNAECIVSQMGAAKAGVTCVSFDERDSQDALDHALRHSNAKGLIFSSNASVTDTDKTRMDLVHNLMPELKNMYAGDELDMANYPHLQHLVQTGHQAIRGVNRWKDVAVYTGPASSNFSMPENHPDDVLQVVLKDGSEMAVNTN